jgi:hypothetical protein
MKMKLLGYLSQTVNNELDKEIGISKDWKAIVEQKKKGI